jgi:quercetin dioxygenase-like cupin family protein
VTDRTASNLAGNARRLREARGLSQQQISKLAGRGAAVVRPLVPEAIPGLDITRMQLEPGGSMQGTPHTPGTREYLTCETGMVELAAAGEVWRLGPGDTLVFRGDQRHSYRNPGRSKAIAFSVVAFAPVAS